MIYQDVIFIHIPRTGGTSIEAAVGMKMGNNDKHLSALELRESVGEKKWKDSFVFSFVRNPWDRIISLYHQPYFRNKTDYANQGLAHFINNYRPAKWERQFYYEYLNTDGIDFIGKFERRKEDLQHLYKLTGIHFNNSMHERKTDRNPDYRVYYDDYSAQLVYDLYYRDIEDFGYKF